MKENLNGRNWLEITLDQYDQTTIRKPKLRTEFSPSQVHSCPRAIWYYMKGYHQDPVEPNSLRRMMVGTIYHTFIQEKLQGAGVLISSEKEVTWQDPPILGHYDAILERTIDKKHILLEIKSMANPKNPNYLQYLPRKEHLIQWNLYSLMTGLDEGIIFYINKNTQIYHMFEVHRDEQIIEDTLAKLRMVKGYLDLDQERIVPYQPDENHDWCSFKLTCQRDYFVKGI